MSKIRNGLMKRVMAVILSGAMVMSSMTSYAAEAGYDAESEYAEVVSEAEETASKEAETTAFAETTTETPDAETEPVSTETTVSTETEAVTETTETETAVPTETESIIESETTASTEAEEITETTETASETEVETESATETESAEEETTEVPDDNMAADGNTVDLKNGLKKGTEYGNDILKFTVLEDMGYKSKTVTVDGVEHKGYVVGTNDPKSADDKSISATNLIPAKGAAFKINAVKDAKVTFVLNQAETKDYYFVKDNGASGECLATGKVTKTDSYTFKMLAGNTYYFCMGGSKANVYAIYWEERNLEEELNRPDWATVADPVISSVALDGKEKTKVIVTVDAVIGSKGADNVAAYMYDKEGKEVGNAESNKEKAQTMLEFFPESSGEYTFKAVTRRDDQEAVKESKLSEAFVFTMPLAVPIMKAATSLGGGQIEVKWGAVAEAEKYVVEVTGDKAIEPITSTASSTVVKDLTIGQKYSFTVYAVRGEETTAKSEPIECEATEKQKLNWNFSNYGHSAKLGKDANGHEVLSDDSVRVWSLNGRGKVVPASTDGLSFYYTTIDPNTTNFTFTATAHVNEWIFSNGQEGFGIMASDTVGENGKGTAFWNNSYQAVISRISYRWNGVEISEDGSGQKIEMQIGAGSTEKVGVTPKDVKDIANGKIVQPERFSAVQSAIDTTFAKYGEGQYNIVGNHAAKDKDGNPLTPPIGSDHEQYVDFDLKIEKNNTGYFVSYTDPNGKTTTKKYYDPNALNLLDSDTVYVGVFASRNADITFNNIKLETRSPEDDPPAESKPVKYLNASNKVLSRNVTNTKDYTLVFQSNWNGKVVIKDTAGNILSKHKETDENGNEQEVDFYKVRGSLDPDLAALQDGDDNRDTKISIELDNLSVGKNVFTVEYTPDKSWTPDVDKQTGQRLTELKSYDPVTITHTVEYRKYGIEGQTIYVSQNGKATNNGTKDSPLDVYTAVTYVQPGQTILLAGGRYSLNRTLNVPKGINGKPDIVDGKETYKNYIKMMAEDPNNRPVLDFNSLVAAMVTEGDYWYFKNFDVIRCKDGEKGIQVSSSWCVFDRVDTYKNGSTGLQICRASSADTYKDWPHDNLILNCNSYLNVDKGFEDADGFAAKLTSGSNNVFDGCIAAFNADDGWDLFAKVQTGSIGAVTIRNSIAYRNGYILCSNPEDFSTLDEFGVLIRGKGNGNGFKMGGDGLAAGTKFDSDYDPSAVIPNSGHKLINSISFNNKSKGFDSNSCPNVKAYNSISFNNEAGNVAFSTYANNPNTDYELRNVISLRTDGASTGDGVATKGKQDLKKVNNETVYYWDASKNAAKNADGKLIKAEDFESLVYESLNCVDKDYWRNPDGTVNTHGFLSLKEGVGTGGKPEDNPSIGGTPSVDPDVGEDTDGSITGGSSTGDSSSEDYGEDFPEGGINVNSGHFGQIWAADIKYLDYETKEPIYYTGKKIEPEVHVRFSADVPLLVKGKGYNVKFRNNVNAGEATVEIIGATHYTGFKTEKTFKILPVDINDNAVSIPSSVAVESGKGDPTNVLKPTWQGKALKKDIDYTITPDPEDSTKLIVKGIGNFTGEKSVNAYSVSADKLISKAGITLLEKNNYYSGLETKPACEVKMNGSVITSGFTVEYANNIKIGKATLTVVGDGVNYFGSKSVNFAIKGGNLKDVVEVEDTKGILTQYVNSGVTYTGTSCAVPEGSIRLVLKKNKDVRLVNGVDYQIVQKGTDKAGAATFTIKGINGYTGSLNYKYKILPLDINDKAVELVYTPEFEFVVTGVKYAEGKNFDIKVNGNVIDSSNYKLTYKNNNLLGEATVTVTGAKCLSGKRNFTFKITPADMTEDINFSISAKEVATGGKDLVYADLKKAGVGVMQSVNGKNKKLSAGRDYDKNAVKYYIDMNNNYEIDDSDIEITDKITSKDTVNEFKEKGFLTILVRVHALESNPKCNYRGYVDGYFRVAMWDIKKVKVTNIKPRVFGKNYKKGNGKSTPMTWTDTEVAKIEDYITFKYWTGKSDETLLCQDLIGAYTYDSTYLDKDGFAIVPNSYKKNEKVGTANFTIKGTGKFVGTKKVSFAIVNKAVADKMAAAGKPVEGDDDIKKD